MAGAAVETERGEAAAVGMGARQSYQLSGLVSLVMVMVAMGWWWCEWRGQIPREQNCPGKGLAYLSLLIRHARRSFAREGTCRTPPPWLPGWWCRKCSGSPSIFASQSMTFISSSVHTGLEA